MPSVERPGGRTVAYEVRGTGKGPFLLVNGALGRDRSSWDFQAPAFEDMTWVVLDQEGTGESPYGGGEISVQTLADDAYAVAGAVGEERIHVAGVSMGAAVAMSLTVDHPDLVESLLLLTPWARTDTHLRLCFQMISDLAEYAPSLVPSEAATTWLLLSRDLINGSPAVEADIATRAEAVAFPNRDGLLAHLRAAIAWDAGDRLAAISAPTFVIGGERDILVPAEHAHAVGAEVPGARVEILGGEEATHGLPIEMASTVNTLVREFYDV